MIWKEILLENEDLQPESMIRGIFLLESAECIPDECFLSGRIVEIGAHRGGTTLRLAALVKKYNLSSVVAIDIFEDNGTEQAKMEAMDERALEYFLNNVNRNNLLDYIEYYKEDSKELGKRWSEPVGFIIFDGSHYYEDVKQDMLIWKEYIVPGGIILIDDYGSWGITPGPKGATDEVFLNNPQYKKLYSSNTFLVLQKTF
jgi:predicted O-methyltransferase YrrM